MTATRFYATGKRKSAIAKVWLSEGTGDIKVNGRPAEDYFTMDFAREMVFQPLSVICYQLKTKKIMYLLCKPMPGVCYTAL